MVFPKRLMRCIPDEQLSEEYDRRKKIKESNGENAADIANVTAFNYMTDIMRRDLVYASTNGEKYAYYAYMQKIVTELITADYRLNHFRSPGDGTSKNIGLPYFLDGAEKKSIGEDRTLYLGEAKNTFLLDAPMLIDRIMPMLDSPKNVAALLVEADTCVYYPCWNLTVVENGSRHRIAEAYINRDTCPVSTLIYEDWRLYGRVTTDGAHWRAKDSGTIIGAPIMDYRLGVIFWLQAHKFDIDPKRALDEMEENKKRFVLKENYDPRLRDAPISE
jgi:hypothetical protein